MAQLTSLEQLRGVLEGRLPQAPISRTLSFWLVEAGEGFAAFEGESEEHLLNSRGMVHGGWALTLLDNAAGCAAHSLLPAGISCATIETKDNFPRPISNDSGRVRAEGRVISQGRHIISAEARVLDRYGKVYAHGLSTLMVRGNWL
ncbi:MAG: PaaI family thioesterase [Pseudomonadota bacterium]